MDKEIIIQGYWDGEPIWRYKTAQEKLSEEFEKNEKQRLSKLELTKQHD